MNIEIKNEDIFPILIEFGVDSTITIELLRTIRHYIEDYLNKKQPHNQAGELDVIFHTLIKKYGIVLNPEEEAQFQAKLIKIGNDCAKKHASGTFSAEIIADIEAPPADDTTQVIQAMSEQHFQEKMSELVTDSEQVQLILQKLGYSRFSDYDMKVFMMYIRMFLESAGQYQGANQERIRQKTMRTLRKKIGNNFLTGRETAFFDYLNQYVSLSE